jgi:hypothetical protein
MGQSMEDVLYQEMERQVKDIQNKDGGAIYDWGKKQIDEYKDVPLKTLLNDSYFLGLEGQMYDGVYEDLCDLWEERESRTVNLAIFLEAIGAGKSFKSSIILWLLWYELSMHENPQKHFGLVDNSIIAVMLMSRTETQAKRVVFTYAWDRFQSGFNNDYFPPNPRLQREIRIERNRTCVYAGTSSALSALGYNVYSAVIDEANFLEVTEDSKKSANEVYDAGEEMYNAVWNRMTSRFMRRGHVPGMIVLISSPLYPDSLLERKRDEIKVIGEKELNAFFRSRNLWEAKGPKYFDTENYFVVDTDTLQIIEEVRKGN